LFFTILWTIAESIYRNVDVDTALPEEAFKNVEEAAAAGVLWDDLYPAGLLGTYFPTYTRQARGSSWKSDEVFG